MLPRVALALLFLFSAVPNANAALILIGAGSDSGGGTILNDGTGDVSSSNGSSSGFTSTLTELGLNDLSDLSQLYVHGQINNPFEPAHLADLVTLRLIGTVANPCSGCATLNDVRVGGTLSLGGPDHDYNPAVVLFAFDIVGSLAGMGLPTQQHLTGAEFSYSLTQDQIDFITTRMSGYGLSDVHIGLGARSAGPAGPYSTRAEVSSVPEPGTLLLLACGIGVAGVRRFRHH